MRTATHGISRRVEETVLAPGAAVEIDTAAECDWALIYVDGSTGGNPILVQRVLDQRRAALRSIPQLRAFLESGARGEAPGGPNRATVLVQAKVRTESPQQVLKELEELRAKLEASRPALR